MHLGTKGFDIASDTGDVLGKTYYFLLGAECDKNALMPKLFYPNGDKIHIEAGETDHTFAVVARLIRF